MEKPTFKEESLKYHIEGKPGKLEVRATTPLETQADLSMAYSPGVAHACEFIVEDPLNASKVTARGNLVAVISNGTAVLGLGPIGALASKPVMEGKAVLMKKFLVSSHSVPLAFPRALAGCGVSTRAGALLPPSISAHYK